MNEKIYLSVFGNPIRNEGAATLMSGITPFKIEYNGYPGVSLVPYYFVITVDDRNTIYKLYCNRVMTADGHQGTLIFAMSVPKGFRLQFGKSPYDVLLKAREMFQHEYMMPTPGISESESYTYKSIRSVEDGFFAPLISEYPLEKLPLHIYHYPMNGSDLGAIHLSADKIRLLLSDYHYPAFIKYKEMVVAEAVDGSYYTNRMITGLELPRKYFFFLKGISNQPINVLVHDKNENFVLDNNNQYRIDETDFDKTIEVSSTEDTECYNRSVTEFTVNELLSGNVNRYVSIDETNYQIRCSIKGTPIRKRYKISLTVDGCEIPYNIHSQLAGKISLKLNGTPIQVIDESFEIVGTQIKELNSNKFDVRLNDAYYEYENAQSLVGDTLRVGLKRKPASDFMMGTNIVRVDEGKDKNNISLSINIPNTLFESISNDNRAYVQIEGKTNGLTFNKTSDFIASTSNVNNKKKKGNRYTLKTAVELDTSVWKNQTVTVIIRGSKKYIKTTRSLGNSKTHEIKFNDDTELKSVVPLIRTIKNINLLITPVLLGVCIGLSILLYTGSKTTEPGQDTNYGQQLKDARKQIHDLEKESKELKEQLRRLKSEQVTKIEHQKIDTPEKDESVDTIVNSALAKNNLSFADVITIYQRNKDRKMSAETRKRLDAYYYVSDILKNGNEDAVKGLMDPKHETLNLLSENHQWNVLSIGWGTQKDVEYAKKNKGNKLGKDGGNGYFVNNRFKYPNFESLKAFMNQRNFKGGE